MKVRFRLVLVEDHALLRAGLKALLAQDEEIEVVGEADNGKDAVRVIESANPHLVLMDITMPGTNGIDAIRDIKRRCPRVRIMILTIHKAPEYIRQSLSAGADGYILKGAALDEFRLAIRTVLGGKSYLTPEVYEGMIPARPGKLVQADSLPTAWDRLTQRERQVLKLIAEGHPNKAIAEYLCLSVKTVEKHRSNLMGKLDLHNASSLTGFAIQNGLLPN